MDRQLELKSATQSADLQSIHALLRENADLKQEIKQLKSRKRYGLIWEDKPEDVVEICKDKLPVLDEQVDQTLQTDNGKPINMLIEGDNYHALSVLNYTHNEKIDLIYLDPPYNTGNQTWKYNNNYVDKEDSYRHSKWLSFMKRRLLLSKKLLKQDGIIVVTIDDYEVFGLGLLMDEVFGENNRIGTLIVESNPRGRTTNTFFATCHEYYLIYGKNAKYSKVENIPLTEEQALLFNLKDEFSNYRLLPFRRSGGLSTPEERPNSYYPIFYDEKTGQIDIEDFAGATAIYPVDVTGRKRVWRQTKPSLMQAVERGDMVIKKNIKGSYTVLMKDRIKAGRKPKTIWINPKYDASSNGTVLLQKMLGKAKSFDYPKSLYAVADFLRVFLVNKHNSTILDFFAGSGTTGHAVLQLNKEDGGNRQFILCTNNENGIAEEVCYPRIKKVIEGWNSTAGLGGNLKYYKTEFVDAETTDKNKKKLVDKSTELLCLKEDCFELVKSGEDFNIFKSAQNKYLGIVYDDNGIENIKQAIKSLNKKTIIYIFSLDESAREEDFEDTADLVSLKPIPTGILNVYRRIFR